MMVYVGTLDLAVSKERVWMLVVVTPVCSWWSECISCKSSAPAMTREVQGDQAPSLNAVSQVRHVCDPVNS